ncbi:unnamed protein product, partial [Polarella glacialis]
VTHQHLLPLMNQVGSCRRVQVGSRGTGFAFFSSQYEAQAAIANLNGVFVMGSNIMVDLYGRKSGMGSAWGSPWAMQSQWSQMPNQWQPQSQWQPQQQWQPQNQWQPQQQWQQQGQMGMMGGMGMKGMGKGGGKGMGDFEIQHPDKTVWLGDLAPGTTHVELMPVMKQAGSCRRIQVGKKGTGFAFFSTAQEAQEAIATLNGASVNGGNIRVDAYTKKSNY